MLKTLSASEMLSLYRLQAGLSPAGAACAIEVTDGIDVDRILAPALRRWYVAMLDTASPRLLPTADIGPALRPTQYAAPAGACRLILPVEARRLLSLQPMSTAAPALIHPAADFDTVMRRQLNPYTAATEDAPEAVMLDGGEAIGIILWPAAASIAAARVVRDPGEDSFILDEQLLAELPPPSSLIANL